MSGKQALYDELAAQLAALLEGESDPIANAANTAALIYHGLPDLNWAGFYFARPLRDPSPGSTPTPTLPRQRGREIQRPPRSLKRCQSHRPLPR